MSEHTVHCNIVSPEGPLYQGDAASVVMTLEKGETAVYPLHAPLVATLGIGEVRVNGTGGVRRFAVKRGFVQVTRKEVNVLVTEAKTPESIDAAAVEAELQALASSPVTTDEQRREKFERQDWLYAQRRVASGK